MNLVSFALGGDRSRLLMMCLPAFGGFFALDPAWRATLSGFGASPCFMWRNPFGGMDRLRCVKGLIVNYYNSTFSSSPASSTSKASRSRQWGSLKLQFHLSIPEPTSQAWRRPVSYVDRARAFMPTELCRPSCCGSWWQRAGSANLVFSHANKDRPSSRTPRFFKVRPLFATLPRLSAPPPFGSEPTGLSCPRPIHYIARLLNENRSSPDDVVRAFSAGNPITLGPCPHRGDLLADGAGHFGCGGHQMPQ